MNIIQHNMAAMGAAAQQQINATNFQKTAKKLGSGYRINSAADDSAGLSISEKMRTQIRGLNRSARNAQEGANFMLVGDGAMNEAHDILHRMSELTVQSLNDTNTPADRAALAAEFEQLQCELDRINNGTYYNTLPVFEKHEPSFYQIAGNRVWASTQQHFVLDPNNSLNIHLPADIYNPAEFTLTVPSGIYTTQELIDEIDTAIENINPKPALNDSGEEIRPGFIFEYTDDGYCNLNFESGEGLYTEISSVDGGLAYLLYSAYDSSNAPLSLLGTTYFAPGNPDGTDVGTLPIVRGQNDTLTFHAETVGGAVSNEITLTIPEGSYTRDEMIDKLNELLKATPGADGIEAKPYGDAYVQLTGGSTKSITGLKGNMFQIDQNVNYSSVFYDNINYGSIRSTPSYFTGSAYYNDGYTDKIKIGETNNTLCFTIDDSDPDNKIEFTIADGEYTMTELAKVLDEGLRALGIASVSVSHTYVTFSGKSVYCDYLRLTSLSTGGDINFNFDQTEGTVAGNTFKSLFVTTNEHYTADPKSSSGSNGSNAYLTGRANLTAPLTINSDPKTLTININSTPYTINLNNTYASLNELTDDIKAKLNAKLSNGQEVEVTSYSSGNIRISGKDNKVTEISLDHSGAYEQLFTTTGTAAKSATATGTGSERYDQGTTEAKELKMATVTLSEPIPSNSTKIDSSNNQLMFRLNSSSYTTITIPDGTYTRQQLISKINECFDARGLNIQASLTNNCLTLTTTKSGIDHPYGLSIGVNSSYGSAWKAILGTTESLLEPTPMSATEGSKAYLQGAKTLDDSGVTINDSNRSFTLNFEGDSHNIDLTSKTYTPADELRSELQAKINAAVGLDAEGNPKINVSITNSGCIRFEAAQGGSKNLTVSDSGFYKEFLQDAITNKQDRNNYYGSHGTYSFNGAFIVGRAEIKGQVVNIIEGANNIFKIDLNYPDPSGTGKTLTKTLTVSLATGSYDNEQLLSALNTGLSVALMKAGIYNIDLLATVGGHYNQNVTGVDADKVLQISVVEKTDANGKRIEAPAGSYYLDGVQGNAVYTLFYKTAGTADPIYIVGSKDVSEGVTFTPKNNELSITVDGTPYTITYPQPASYTAEELIDKTNELLTGQNVPIEASLEDGRVKFTHKEYADKIDHSITNVSGSAAGTVFYNTGSRDLLNDFMLQVGALGHQGLEVPRFSINTASLGINSLTITKPKYANKALDRLNKALDLLSSKRSTYGALTNRIDHVVSNNKNTSENVQASESRIRDADMADEMVSLTKYRILLQASQSILAQANQTPNNILTLLQ